MPVIELCLDTSAATTVALVRDGTVVARAHEDSMRRHAESVTPLVREVLAAAGIEPEGSDTPVDGVYAGTGPAPFTGLRAGLVTARVLARAWGARLAGASSLDILARQALDLLAPDAQVVVATDARRKEVYWAAYRALGPDDVERQDGPEVEVPAKLANVMAHSESVLVTPADLPAHARLLGPAGVGGHLELAELDPAVLSRLVAARTARGREDLLGTEPLYLRRPDIQGQPTQRL